MKKVILASHHTFAAGLKDTIEYIIPNAPKITAISAYLDNKPVEEEIKAAFSDVTPEDDVLIFTDLMSGSVNQAFVPYLKNANVHLVTGMNLPVVMSILLTTMSENLSDELIRKCISEAQTQILYVNDVLNSSVDEEDE